MKNAFLWSLKHQKTIIALLFLCAILLCGVFFILPAHQANAILVSQNAALSAQVQQMQHLFAAKQHEFLQHQKNHSVSINVKELQQIAAQNAIQLIDLNMKAHENGLETQLTMQLLGSFAQILSFLTELNALYPMHLDALRAAPAENALSLYFMGSFYEN